MPLLNTNHLTIRNSNSMDTVKLIDMLSKLGVLKKKTKRSNRRMPEPQVEQTPLEGAQRFLTSRPVINMQNGGSESAKMVDIERLRREAFGYMARVTDALERQREEQALQPVRMQPDQHISRYENAQMADEDVDIEGVNNNVVPDVNDAEMDRVGPVDMSYEMTDDRNIAYAGEDGKGTVFDAEDDNGFYAPPSREQLESLSSTRDVGDIELVHKKPAEKEPAPAPASVSEARAAAAAPAPARRNIKLIDFALQSLGINSQEAQNKYKLSRVIRNKNDINHMLARDVEKIYGILHDNNVDIIGNYDGNLAQRRQAVALSLEKYASENM